MDSPVDEEELIVTPRRECIFPPITLRTMLCVTPAATPYGVHSPQPPSPSSRPSSTISVRDIYETIESERHSARRRNSERAIENAQLLTMYGGSESPRPDIISLPSNSRPPSAISRTLTNMSRTNTALSRDDDYGNYERCITSYSAPGGFNICKRSRSAIEREMEGVVNCLSRQCCDVLGPRVCHECNKIKRRERGNEEYESGFHNLHVSEDNFATTVVISKRMPGLTSYQIQDKVARGEISRPDFRRGVIRRKSERQKELSKSVPVMGGEKKRGFALLSSTYFNNIRDLNEKIIAGQVSSKLRAKGPLNKTPVNTDLKIKTFSDMVMPTFISARKIKPKKEKFVKFFDPPLLPKVCQNVEPAFFAGSDAAYKLPDRLPDKIFPGQDSPFPTPAISRTTTEASTEST